MVVRRVKSRKGPGRKQISAASASVGAQPAISHHVPGGYRQTPMGLTSDVRASPSRFIPPCTQESHERDLERFLPTTEPVTADNMLRELPQSTVYLAMNI